MDENELEDSLRVCREIEKFKIIEDMEMQGDGGRTWSRKRGAWVEGECKYFHGRKYLRKYSMILKRMV